MRPLEPAGRGTKIRQPLCLTMVDAVADLYQQFVKHYTGGDYAIFGHSLGGIMAFELVHYILDHGHDMPRALFFRLSPTRSGLSGCNTAYHARSGVYGRDRQAVRNSG
ncbi:hypothetical protein EZW76_000526 [Escherichia coli]|nr:hypothetical protein [Escherichia coli]